MRCRRCRCACWTPRPAPGQQWSAARRRARSCPSRVAVIRCAAVASSATCKCCRAAGHDTTWLQGCLVAASCLCGSACLVLWLACSPKHACPHSPQGCLVGSKLFVFGGEDVMRRPLGELLVLDLATWRWSRPETSGASGAAMHLSWVVVLHRGTAGQAAGAAPGHLAVEPPRDQRCACFAAPC